MRTIEITIELNSQSALRGSGVSNSNELRKLISQLKSKIQKTKHKIAIFTGSIEESISEARNCESIAYDYY